ncbi:MAG: hypothetical protein AB1Z63_04825 [Candidatus Limnocylindrales bacterium]
MNRLADDYGDEAVSTALASEWQAEADIKTLIGRAETRLGSQAKLHEKEAERRRKNRVFEDLDAARMAAEERTPEQQAAVDQWKADLAEIAAGKSMS